MSTVTNTKPTEIKSLLLSSLLHFFCNRDVYVLFTEYENWRGSLLDRPATSTARILEHEEPVFYTKSLRWPIVTTREFKK